jgi:hypothetical protein
MEAGKFYVEGVEDHEVPLSVRADPVMLTKTGEMQEPHVSLRFRSQDGSVKKYLLPADVALDVAAQIQTAGERRLGTE